MTQTSHPSAAALWARFRFSVVGSLLSSPPARGELKAAIGALAAKTWTHPISGRDVRFAAGTIERWYYTSRREKDDPVGVLRRAVRKDCGQVSLAPAFAEHLFNQYQDHKHWSYKLHYDNLAAVVQADPSLGPLRSYSTVRRYMKAHGLVRKPRPVPKGRPGETRAARRREAREIRSYEVEYVGSLWHLDFHHGSLKVLTHNGQWQRPLVLGILDDYSRLCCHLQWYLSETAEDLAHGLSQAIQKRGLPRALLTDNGPAMVADEVTEGLLRLGIVHERTLPYSPYQNGKQESFWATLEGRLMEMLDGFADLTLDFLNEATQAWVEIEYNRAVHREISTSPVERFAQAADVLRSSPSTDALRDAFRLETKRRQRQSDGTISLCGVRFEIPARYRHFRDVVVRYARWDLGRVDLVDSNSGTTLAPIYPLDRSANADGYRAVVKPSEDDVPAADGRRSDNQLPPLLKRILAEYSATGMPPAYLPKKPPLKKGKES
ncbi:MAG: DDE-type integrase/transposase/recombinase [Phycisphaerae bacterium]